MRYPGRWRKDQQVFMKKIMKRQKAQRMVDEAYLLIEGLRNLPKVSTMKVLYEFYLSPKVKLPSPFQKIWPSTHWVRPTTGDNDLGTRPILTKTQAQVVLDAVFSGHIKYLEMDRAFFDSFTLFNYSLPLTLPAIFSSLTRIHLLFMGKLRYVRTCTLCELPLVRALHQAIALEELVLSIPRLVQVDMQNSPGTLDPNDDVAALLRPTTLSRLTKLKVRNLRTYRSTLDKVVQTHPGLSRFEGSRTHFLEHTRHDKNHCVLFVIEDSESLGSKRLRVYTDYWNYESSELLEDVEMMG